MVERTNWAGNHRYRAARLHRPRTVDELQELVRATPRLKVLGSRHSFTDIADTDGDQVSLDGLPRFIDVDHAAATVTVDGAIRYGDLAPVLHGNGVALHNLASLPHISVAGACATATHGSGDRSGNLATAVRTVELVEGTGEHRRIDRDADPEVFAGVVVHLGALGVVTRLTLAIEPSYAVRQDLFEHLPLATLADRFDEITSAADSVSLFTTWSGETVDQVWLKRRIRPDEDRWDPPAALFGASRATRSLHPVPTMSPASTTEQLGVPGPWHERLPHFRMDHMPSAGDELQTEYFVARADGPSALAALDGIRARIAPLVQTSELRTIAADDLWLSPAYRRDAVAIHFTWLPDWPGVSAMLPVIEDRLAPFDPRPHWAKLSALGIERYRATYPKLEAFSALRDRFDPDRRFANAFLARTVG
jgi:alditol oxidase